MNENTPINEQKKPGRVTALKHAMTEDELEKTKNELEETLRIMHRKKLRYRSILRKRARERRRLLKILEDTLVRDLRSRPLALARRRHPSPSPAGARPRPRR